MMDLLLLHSIQHDRDRERARLDLVARARRTLGSPPGRIARVAARLRAVLPRRAPCPDPPCLDLDPRAPAAFDR